MAIKVRAETYQVHTKVKTESFKELSRHVSSYTGFVVPPNKAIVGKNAFAHESGIHQHGVIINRNTYEIIDPVEIGGEGSSIVMGRHSGRHALHLKLKQHGFELGENAFEDLYRRFKEIADMRKTVTDDEILSLIQRQ